MVNANASIKTQHAPGHYNKPINCSPTFPGKNKGLKAKVSRDRYCSRGVTTVLVGLAQDMLQVLRVKSSCESHMREQDRKDTGAVVPGTRYNATILPVEYFANKSSDALSTARLW